MPIEKIKFTGSTNTGTEITYSDGDSKNSKAIKYTSYDERHPDFTNAMKSLLVEAERVLGFEDGYLTGPRVVSAETGGVIQTLGEVTGISVSENDHQGVGCVVTIQRSFEEINSPLVINTPHLHEDLAEQGLSVMPGTMREKVFALITEAEDFIGGKRAQGEMFENKPFGDKEKAALKRKMDRVTDEIHEKLGVKNAA